MTTYELPRRPDRGRTVSADCQRGWHTLDATTRCTTCGRRYGQ